jgi:hypothetical protein
MLLVGPGSALASDDFTDVPSDHPFHAEITRLSDLGITTGFPDGTFGPGQSITRRAIMAYAYRAAGSPPGPFTETFTDVEPGDGFYTEIAWAQETGITDGFSDGTFRAGLPVSREAFAAVAYRLSGEPVGVYTEDFSDVAPGDPFYTEIAWAATNDVVNGYDDNTFRPGIDITRQAVAALMVRAVNEGFFGGSLGANQDFTLTPAERVELVLANETGATPAADDRDFTGTGFDNAKTYRLALFPSANITTVGKTVSFADTLPTASGNSQADGIGTSSALMTFVNGTATGGARNTTAKPVGGKFTVIVDGVASEETTLVIFEDNGTVAGQLELDGNNKPTEPFAISGVTKFVNPEQANTAATASSLITALDKGLNRVELSNGTSVFYAATQGDRFYIGGVNDPNNQVTEAAFEARLTVGDGVDTSPYNQTFASSINLTDTNPTATPITSSTNRDVSVLLTITAPSPGANINVYLGPGGGGAYNASTDDQIVSTSTDADTAAAGFQYTVTGLTPSTSYDCFASQSIDGEESTISAAWVCDTITTVEKVRPTVTDAWRSVDGAPGGVLITSAGVSTDTIDFAFSEEMAAGLGGATTFFRLSNGTDTFQVDCNGACTLDDLESQQLNVDFNGDANDHLQVDLAAATITRIAGIGGLDTSTQTITVTLASSAFTDVALNQVDLAGSADISLSDQ